MELQTRAEGLLADLIAFPTVSADSNLALIDWAAETLRGLGAEIAIFRDETGSKANLLATFGPVGDGGVVLSGHSDVVPVEGQEWQSDPFTLTARGELLFGRGTCDMKGFIACVLALAPDFAKWRLTRPLHVALTYDEETGCLGAQALARDLEKIGLRPGIAILGEPTGMRVIEGHKGCHEYTTAFQGLEGHGSDPRKGVNAAEYAVRYATELMALSEQLKDRVPENSRFDPPWTTLNIGRINGGSIHNIIAGRAEIDWEMRPVASDDADFVLEQIDGFARDVLLPHMQAIHTGARIDRHVIGEVAGLEPMPQNDAADLVAALTGENARGLVPFGTEAGVFQSLGMHCVVCGPGHIAQAHKPDEFISRDQLRACLAMLKGLQNHM